MANLVCAGTLFQRVQTLFHKGCTLWSKVQGIYAFRSSFLIVDSAKPSFLSRLS